jgi:hypothetical protein
LNEGYQLRGVRVGAVIAVAAVAAFLIWYFAIRDSDGGDGTSNQPTTATGQRVIGPVEESTNGLESLSKKLDQTIYWAGSQPNTKLEFTRNGLGQAYVRYLPPDIPIGDRNKGYLTIATFPFKNAYDALQTVAKKPGAIVKNAPDNGLVVTNEDSPIHVYVAYPGEDFQIEVYDPDPARALDVATSGDVQPVR